MTPRQKTALELHALAHDIATGQRPIIGIRWYHPDPATRLIPVPVIPMAMHDALCPSTAINLTDETGRIHICDECKVAIEDEAATAPDTEPKFFSFTTCRTCGHGRFRHWNGGCWNNHGDLDCSCTNPDFTTEALA